MDLNKIAQKLTSGLHEEGNLFINKNGVSGTVHYAITSADHAHLSSERNTGLISFRNKEWRVSAHVNYNYSTSTWVLDEKYSYVNDNMANNAPRTFRARILGAVLEGWIDFATSHKDLFMTQERKNVEQEIENTKFDLEKAEDTVNNLKTKLVALERKLSSM